MKEARPGKVLRETWELRLRRYGFAYSLVLPVVVAAAVIIATLGSDQWVETHATGLSGVIGVLGGALHMSFYLWLRHRGLDPASPEDFAFMAAKLAGRRRAHLAGEWAAHLVGNPETGERLSRLERMRYAGGFLCAAVRLRIRDLVTPLWRPIDWLLATESRTRTVMTLAVGTQVIYIVRQDGLYKLLTEGWGWCAGCAVALHFLFRWLRTIRGVELAASGSGEER